MSGVVWGVATSLIGATLSMFKPDPPKKLNKSSAQPKSFNASSNKPSIEVPKPTPSSAQNRPSENNSSFQQPSTAVSHLGDLKTTTKTENRSEKYRNDVMEEEGSVNDGSEAPAVKKEMNGQNAISWGMSYLAAPTFSLANTISSGALSMCPYTVP